MTEIGATPASPGLSGLRHSGAQKVQFRGLRLDDPQSKNRRMQASGSAWRRRAGPVGRWDYAGSMQLSPRFQVRCYNSQNEPKWPAKIGAKSAPPGLSGLRHSGAIKSVIFKDFDWTTHSPKFGGYKLRGRPGGAVRAPSGVGTMQDQCS